jgi:hypothetical protein
MALSAESQSNPATDTSIDAWLNLGRPSNAPGIRNGKCNPPKPPNGRTQARQLDLAPKHSAAAFVSDANNT